MHDTQQQQPWVTPPANGQPQGFQQQAGQPPHAAAPAPGWAPAPVVWAPPPPAGPPAQPVGGGWSGWAWAGAIAGGLALAAVTLVCGVLIGQSTRMSDDEVTQQLDAQREADGAAQRRALSDLEDRMDARRRAAVRDATARAQERGRRLGDAEGHQRGFSEGETTGRVQSATPPVTSLPFGARGLCTRYPELC